MSDKLNARNINALNENDKTLNAKLSEALLRLNALEGKYAALHAEVANTKQMIGHTLGRGMGSTKNDG